MPRTISSGRGGFYVEAAPDLGAARDEVPAVQHHDPDLLLYRKVFRPFVWPASLIVVEHPEGTQIIFCSFHNFLNVRVAASRLCF